MDYYGPESQREQYFKNMGLAPDGATALSAPQPLNAPPNPSMTATPMGAGNVGRYQADQQVSSLEPQPPQMNQTPRYNSGINPAATQQRPSMHPPIAQPTANFTAQKQSVYSQTPKNGSRPNMGGNPNNTVAKQVMPPPGQPQRQNRRTTPMGA